MRFPENGNSSIRASKGEVKCTRSSQYILYSNAAICPPLSLEDIRVTGITKMTGTNDASCPRHPARCHPADATTVRLVKLIEHTTEETDSLYQVGATQKVQGSGLPVISGE